MFILQTSCCCCCSKLCSYTCRLDRHSSAAGVPQRLLAPIWGALINYVTKEGVKFSAAGEMCTAKIVCTQNKDVD